MSAADEALRVLIVQHKFLDERAAAHLYRQALASGKSLDMYLLDEKILEPEDIVTVVEERAKNALACRGCKTVTYLLPGQSASTLICVRCKTPFVGSKRVAQSSQFNVIQVKRSKAPLVIAALMLVVGGALLYVLQQQREDASAQAGAQSNTVATGDQAELEVLADQMVETAAAGQWGRHFDCFSKQLRVRMTLKAVLSAGRAVAADSSLRKDWLNVCARNAWIRVQSDEDALAEKISTRLDQDEQREFYVEVQRLLKAEPASKKTAKLSHLKISEGNAKALMTVTANGKAVEQKVKFALENEEWRIKRIWN